MSNALNIVLELPENGLDTPEKRNTYLFPNEHHQEIFQAVLLDSQEHDEDDDLEVLIERTLQTIKIMLDMSEIEWKNFYISTILRGALLLEYLDAMIENMNEEENEIEYLENYNLPCPKK